MHLVIWMLRTSGFPEHATCRSSVGLVSTAMNQVLPCSLSNGWHHLHLDLHASSADSCLAFRRHKALWACNLFALYPVKPVSLWLCWQDYSIDSDQWSQSLSQEIAHEVNQLHLLSSLVCLVSEKVNLASPTIFPGVERWNSQKHSEMCAGLHLLKCFEVSFVAHCGPRKRIEILMIPMPVISGPTSGTSQCRKLSSRAAEQPSSWAFQREDFIAIKSIQKRSRTLG